MVFFFFLKHALGLFALFSFFFNLFLKFIGTQT